MSRQPKPKPTTINPTNKWLLLLGLPGVTLMAAAATEAAAAGELPAISSLLLPSVIILVLIIMNGVFVAAEFAIVGVRATSIETLADSGRRDAAGVLQVLQSPLRQDRYIATAQLGITLASLGLGMYGEREISHFIEPYLAGWLGFEPHDAFIATTGYIIAVSLLTYLHVVIGEMVPKSLALADATRSVLWLNAVMRVSQAVLIVPVIILNGIGRGVMWLMRVPPIAGHERIHSPEELEMIVSESAEGGLLKQDEGELIRNIIDFSEREVLQVMTPRTKIEALDLRLTLPEIIDRVTRSNHSRFPVYVDDIDHIIGVVHVRDLVRAQRRNPAQFDIRLIARPALVVPEHFPIERLLARFRSRRTHMAVVIDEYGGTAGITTLEDVVEEIMGEVRDEFDYEHDEVIVVSNGVLDAAGHYLLDDLDDFNVPLGDEDNLPDVETIGGLIITGLGRPPKVNDVYIHNKTVTFTVTAVDGLAVSRCRIEFLPPVASQGD